MRAFDLIPWSRKLAPERPLRETPFLALQHEMNRLFDDFFRDIPEPFTLIEGGRREFAPRVEVVEKDGVILVTAELPGMDEKDVEVTLTADALTLTGEKKEEAEVKEKKEGYFHSERFYGRFKRVIPLPEGVETDKVEATFKKGVLTVTLPKAEVPEEKAHRINIKAA
ncbi:MAG: Hsp20/alpha crystallin family protein [Leptospirillia bacterium]